MVQHNLKIIILRAHKFCHVDGVTIFPGTLGEMAIFGQGMVAIVLLAIFSYFLDQDQQASLDMFPKKRPRKNIINIGFGVAAMLPPISRTPQKPKWCLRFDNWYFLKTNKLI